MAIDPRLECLPEQEGPANRTWQRIMESTFGTVHPVVTSLVAEPRTQARPERLDDFIPLDTSHKGNSKDRERPDTSSNPLIKNKRLKSDNEGINSQATSHLLAPWKCQEYPENAFGLHLEIMDFFKFMSPYAEEEAMRRDVVERMKNLILTIWPTSRVEVFGSFKTNLYLPTSDIDLVVFGNLEKSPLHTLEKVLVSKDIADPSSIKVLDKASVPIVKLTDKVSKVKVDISFNMETAIQGAAIIKSFVDEFRALPYLFLVLKQFLVQRDLNEVFTGGISSYCLMLLAVSFLQRHPRDDATSPEANVGVLLMEFFELYGRNFNYQRTGIKIKNGGCYVSKEEMIKEMSNGEFPSLLCIEDPVTQGIDIGKSSYGIMRIKEAFDHAYLVLDKALRNRHYHKINPNSTYLSRIIQIPEEVLTYRKWVKRIYGSSVPAALPSTPVLSPSHVSMPSATFTHPISPYPGSGTSPVPIIPSSPVMAYPQVNGAFPSLGVTVLHPASGAILLPTCSAAGTPSLIVRPYPLSPLNQILANPQESCSSPILLSSDDDVSCGDKLSEHINNRLILSSHQNNNSLRTPLTDSDSSGNECITGDDKFSVTTSSNTLIFESSLSTNEGSPLACTNSHLTLNGRLHDERISDSQSAPELRHSDIAYRQSEYGKPPLGRRGSLTITALERVSENFLKEDRFASCRSLTDGATSENFYCDLKDPLSKVDSEQNIHACNGCTKCNCKAELKHHGGNAKGKHYSAEPPASQNGSGRRSHDLERCGSSKPSRGVCHGQNTEPLPWSDCWDEKGRHGHMSPNLSKRNQRTTFAEAVPRGTQDDLRHSATVSDHEKGVDRGLSTKKIGKQNTERPQRVPSISSPSIGRRHNADRDAKFTDSQETESPVDSVPYRHRNWTIELEDHGTLPERAERSSGSLSPRHWRPGNRSHSDSNNTPPESPRSPRVHKTGPSSQRRRSKKEGKYSG